MKAFVSSFAALFLAVGVIGCGDTNTGDSSPALEQPEMSAEHEAMMTGGSAPEGGHEAEGGAAPAEGEGDAAAPAEGEAKPAEGDAAAPAEGEAKPAEGEAAAPAEGEAKTE